MFQFGEDLFDGVEVGGIVWDNAAGGIQTAEPSGIEGAPPPGATVTNAVGKELRLEANEWRPVRPGLHEAASVKRRAEFPEILNDHASEAARKSSKPGLSIDAAAVQACLTGEAAPMASSACHPGRCKIASGLFFWATFSARQIVARNPTLQAARRFDMHRPPRREIYPVTREGDHLQRLVWRGNKLPARAC